MRIKYHFHIKDFAISLDLKQRFEATQKWPITCHGCDCLKTQDFCVRHHVCELFDSQYNTSANQNARLSIRNFANILYI